MSGVIVILLRYVQVVTDNYNSEGDFHVFKTSGGLWDLV